MTSNVIELQPTDETMKRVIEATNRAWNQGGTPVELQPKETLPSVRTIAREQDVDLKRLINILQLQRPAGSTTEQQFADKLSEMLPDTQVDGYGNIFLTIGDNPNIMWSCHTDTVAKQGGFQNVKWNGDELILNDPKPGQCLGADDGAGLWLLLEMIDAKVPGLYIFHRDEEIGGKGSRWLAANNQSLLKNIEIAIAFDRRDVDSVITHQGGQRTASDKFGNAIAAIFNQVEGLHYDLDTGGTFTDTKSYVSIIPECTNISVGYYSEHTSRERLDVRHLLRLREALISYDFSNLPVERDPTVEEYDDYSWGGGYYSYSGTPKNKEAKTGLEGILEIVKERPYTIAQMLYNMGMDPIDLEDIAYKVWQRTLKPTIGGSEKKKDTHGERVADYLRRTGQDEDDTIGDYALWCNDCGDFCDEDYIYSEPAPGDACPNCYQSDTELIEVELDTVTGEIV